MPRRTLWVLFVLFGLIWFVGMDSRNLAEPDEGRYAEIPREMLASGDWVTPRLNGFKYFEKPALQYWATAAAYRVFGVSEGPSRLYATGLAFLTIPLLFWLGRRLYNSATGLIAALLLGSSLMWVGVGHVNTLDIALGFWLTAALAALLVAEQTGNSPQQARRWIWAAWAAIALAVLQKGLVAIVLPGFAMALYMLVQRDWRLLLRLRLLEGAIIVAAICAPWFVVVSLRNPEFPGFFFIHEHFTRFLTKVHKRDEPWWYFAPWLLVGVLPWIVPVWRGVLAGWQRKSDSFHVERLLVLWPAATFVFFSASGSKLPPYIVPMLPPLALLAARWIADAEPRQIGRAVLPWAAGMGLVLAAAGLVAWGVDRPPINQFAMLAPIVLLAAGTLIVGTALAYWRLAAGRSLASVAVLAFSSLAAIQLLLTAYGTPSVERTSAPYAAIIQPRLAPGAPLYFVSGYWQSLPFYLQRTGQLVEFQGELEFGIGQEPQRWLANTALFAASWREHPNAIAVINPAVADDLLPTLGPVRILFRDRRAVIIEHP